MIPALPALANLQPEPIWKHFDRLAAIPRASTKEAAARDYVLSLAAKLRLESLQDDAGNLVIRKPARSGREFSNSGDDQHTGNDVYSTPESLH